MSLNRKNLLTAIDIAKAAGLITALWYPAFHFAIIDPNVQRFMVSTFTGPLGWFYFL